VRAERKTKHQPKQHEIEIEAIYNVHGDPCTVIKAGGNACGVTPSIWYVGKHRFCRDHKAEAYAAAKHSPKDAYREEPGNAEVDSTPELETELVEV
jgi:hypothetical protein